MPFTKPTSRIPLWASGGTKTDPGASKEAAGWNTSEKPPAQWINWLYNAFGAWLGWAEDTIDEGCAKAGAQVYVNNGVATKNANSFGITSVARNGSSVEITLSAGISSSVDLYTSVSVNTVEGGPPAIPFVNLSLAGFDVVAVSFYDDAGALIDLSTTDVYFSFLAFGPFA